jgi:hypothetical protein
MHPIGIALAFLIFWSLVAIGLFFIITGGRRLTRVWGQNPFWAVTSLFQAFFGWILVATGIAAAIIVLYGSR